MMVVTVPTKGKDVFFEVSDNFNERLNDFMKGLSEKEQVNRRADFEYLKAKCTDDEIVKFFEEMNRCKPLISLSKFTCLRVIEIKNISK